MEHSDLNPDEPEPFGCAHVEAKQEKGWQVARRKWQVKTLEQSPPRGNLLLATRFNFLAHWARI
jgi:hypothetical protein